MKYCIGCKYLQYDEPEFCYGSSATGCYSEEDAALACKKGHWRHLFNKTSTRDTFRKAMETAETCEDYEERDLEQEAQEHQAYLDKCAAESRRAEEADKKLPLYCSFCGETDRQLVQGPSVYICNECLILARSLMEEGETVKIKGDLK